MNNSSSSASVPTAKQQGRKRKQGKRSESQEGSENGSSFVEFTKENHPQDQPKEVIPYHETEVMKTEGAPAVVYENGASHLPLHPRWYIPGIRKDDEFFHFIILCFAVGTLLVCYYKYNNWTVSFGVGLMTFAALETTGIYFGLVYRIRSVLESFIPLLQRVKMPGFKKVD